MRSSARVQTRPSGYVCRWCCAIADDLPGVIPEQTYQTPAQPGTRHRRQGRGTKPDASGRVPCGIVHSLLCWPQDVVCVLTTHASRPRCWARARRPQRSLGGARVSYLSLQAHPSPGGSLGFSLVGVGFFVFLHGLPENSVAFFEMLDAFAEFSLFSHQHSVASLQFLKAQAQRFLLLAPARGIGRAMASLRLKLFDRRVKHLAVFEQIKRL